MGITARQAADSLERWNDIMLEKIETLKKGARFYRVANYFAMVSSGVLTVVMIGLSSSLVSGVSAMTVFIIAIILIALQAINAFFTVSIAVVQPSTKANNCMIAAKQYDLLSREITIKVIEYRQVPGNAVANSYLFETLNYSTREQLVMQNEPHLVYYGHISGAATRIPAVPDYQPLAQREETEVEKRCELASIILNYTMSLDEVEHLLEHHRVAV